MFGFGRECACFGRLRGRGCLVCVGLFMCLSTRLFVCMCLFVYVVVCVYAFVSVCVCAYVC